MKFKDTKRLSPVIYENDLPHEKDLFHIAPRLVPEAEKAFERFIIEKDIIIDDEWWDIQLYRCLNGYTVQDAIIDGGDCFVDGVDVTFIDDDTRYIPHLDLYIKDNAIHITGRHYFYLNFWKIKRYDEKMDRKIVGNPRFTDLSCENWMIRDLMKRSAKDNLWTKSRQKGLSEEEACDTAYDFLFYAQSQSVIIAGEEKYSDNTFRFLKRGLLYLLNTQFYKTIDKNNDKLLSTKYTGSEIHCRTAKDNPEALSSLSPSKALFEECGIWTKNLVKETAEYLKASTSAEGNKTGWIQYIATGGELENSINDVHEMFHEPEKFDLLTFKNRYSKDTTTDALTACFIPAWKFEITDEDGNSIRKESEESILKYRASAKASERFKRTSQKPLTPEELFNLSSGGYFGESITQLLNERFYYISTHRDSQIEQVGRLEWKDREKPWSGVDFEHDSKGTFVQIEKPVMGVDGKPVPNLYLAGTDSYDQDEAHYSDSKGSMSIKKRFLDLQNSYNLPIAHLIERPLTSEGGAEVFYENVAKACIYYGIFGMNNIEWSNPRIFDWLVNHGFEGVLMTRPMIATANVIKQSYLQNRYGTDKSLKPHYLAILRDKLTPEYIARMFIRRQIQALAQFRYDPSGKKYNCDTTISLGLMELADKEHEFIVAKEKKTNENIKKGYRAYRTINGQLKEVYL